jgi:flagellar protein FliO/FliZ
MVGSVVGMQQIIITVGFLGVMVVLLVILKLKGGGLRRSLHQGRRISVIEETAISPTEKMRLVSIDDREFVILTSKGVQPVLTELGAVSAQPASPANIASQDSEAPLTLTQQASVSPSAFQRALEKAADDQGGDTGELKAFSEKFKSWRLS